MAKNVKNRSEVKKCGTIFNMEKIIITATAEYWTSKTFRSRYDRIYAGENYGLRLPHAFLMNYMVQIWFIKR